VIDDAHDIEAAENAEAVDVGSASPETPTEIDDSVTEAVEVGSAPPETPTESDYAVLETFEVTSPLPETTTEVDDSVAEAVEVDGPPAQTKRRRPRLPRPPRLPRTRLNPKVVSVIALLLVVVSGGTAWWVYFRQYRPDQQTDPGVARAVVSAATDGTEAVLSYSSDTLDQDFAAARSHLGGEFLSYYKQFTAQVVAPAAKLKSLKTTAHVAGAAVSELHPDSAVVLVFVDQTTSIKDNPLPSLAVSSVLLNMTRINGNWLITKFAPI
jgi:Mce-associated membrane protein